MLIVFQVPLADLRAFRADGARRIRPHFPTPDSGVEFVRLFGPVRQRQKRKPLPWDDEQFYVDASRALHLIPFTDERKRWSCAFRRLLSDGGAVVRLEVGIHIPPGSFPAGGRMLDTLATMLETPCILRGEKAAGKLVQISKKLARLYANATASRGTRVNGDEVVAGQPTVLVQFDEGEGAGMPKSLDFDRDHLAFLNSTHSGVTMNLWFTNAGFGDPRNTRIALLRLSAEHQCLKFVLRDITDGNVNLDEVSPRTERLQDYLSLTDRTLSKDTRFGVHQTDLIRLTQTFETLSGGSELVLLRQQLNKIRPQIRTKILQLVDAANSQQPPVQKMGPDFDYQGSFDEIEYQSFLNTPRPLLDLQWTADVVARLCPAVCLIEIPSIGRSATGFLVARDLILTNWHVVEEFPGDDKAANLANMRMTFTFSAQKDRSFRLALANPASPLVVGSPPAFKDFVLLRVSEDVAGTLNVVPFHCDASSLPVKHQAINIIQHPGGGPLKLSADVNGVSGVDKELGKVQYISITEPGSSGSPCIDSEKRLVAIHHAEVNGRVFSVREGILISSIYADMSPFLV